MALDETSQQSRAGANDAIAILLLALPAFAASVSHPCLALLLALLVFYAVRPLRVSMRRGLEAAARRVERAEEDERDP
jgi:hypothetical protein